MMLELPSPPSVRRAEFARRYVAAETIARRYAAAVLATTGSPVQERLVEQWPTVLSLLDKIAHTCAIGARTPRQRKGAPRAHKLHQVHIALVALEKAVDAAVATAVIALLTAEEATASRRAEADEWLRALTTALNELKHSPLWQPDEGSAAWTGDL
jgi:hypothetical protein